MINDKLRRQITHEAARLLYVQHESEYYQAKLKAARRICRGWVRPADLPTDREIREAMQALSRARPFGTALADQPLLAAKDDGLSSTGGPSCQSGGEPADSGEPTIDPFRMYYNLLMPLEAVMQNPESHPEGDVLYHSLQVFELARNALPYDEEFQLAALLHDVGKGIDARNHIPAGLAALEGYITERTAWFIEHHSEAGALRDGTLGVRARRRLEAADDFDDLMTLCDCDRRGRQRGVQVPDVEDALAHLQDLARSNG